MSIFYVYNAICETVVTLPSSLEEAECLGDQVVFLSGGAEDHGDDLDETLAGEDQLSGGDVVVLGHVGLGEGLAFSGVYKDTRVRYLERCKGL
jgi:hypothetical protein